MKLKEKKWYQISIRTDKLGFKISMVILLLVVSVMFSLVVSVEKEIRADKHRVTCAQFKTHQEAQKYYDTKQKGYYNLYADKNGIVCKTLSWE